MAKELTPEELKAKEAQEKFDADIAKRQKETSEANAKIEAASDAHLAKHNEWLKSQEKEKGKSEEK